MKLDPEMQAIADEALEAVRTGQLRSPEDVEMWWERRRDGEPTADYLGRVLAEAGLLDTAKRARRALYDDYFCPADVADGLETLRLVRDLRRERRTVSDPEQVAKIDKIDEAIRAGEFDGTKAESDRWMASEGGQRTIGQLAPAALRGQRVGRNEPCPCGSGRKYKHCHGQ